MKAYLSRLVNIRTPRSHDEFQYWRERIIGISLLGVSVLITGFYTYYLLAAIKNQAWARVILYTLCFVLAILVTLIPKVPYRIRAATTVVFVFVLGIFTAVLTGNGGGSSLWMVLFIVLATIFINRWAGIGAVVLSATTLLFLGFGLNGGWLQNPGHSDVVLSTTSWINIAIIMFAVGLISVMAFSTLLDGLEKSLHTRHLINQDMVRDREKYEHLSQEIKRREIQLRTAAEITRVISAELNPDQLFQSVVNLVKEHFNLYYVGVFIVHSGSKYASLVAGTGDAGQLMVDLGHKLAVDSNSMIGWAISRRQARIALDVGQEAVFFDNPYLPETRSELALPMITSAQVLGAITVQSTQPEAFDQEDIIVLQGVADSLAIAVQNARLFDQAETNLKEMRSIHQQYLGKAWAGVIASQGGINYTYENQEYSTENGSQSTILEKPIAIRDNVIGHLVLESEKSSWDPDEEAFIEAVVSQAAIALENVRLMETTQRSAQQDRMITDLSSKVWASTDIDTILQTTLRELVQGLHATNGLIMLDMVEPESKENENSHSFITESA